MIPVFVTVRNSSTRLPGKCFLKLGEYTVLEFILNRLPDSVFYPIVCTSTDSSDDLIADFCTKNSFHVFRGSLENKVRRWSDCVNEFGLNYVHLLDCDDPYFDPLEVEFSYTYASKNSLGILKTSMKSDFGFASVGTTVNRDFITGAAILADKENSQDFDVIPWDLISPEGMKIERLPDSTLTQSRNLARLTLDYQEDYELLTTLAEQFGPSSSRLELENYLNCHPELLKINDHRSQDFLDNKKRKLKTNFNLSQ